MTVRLYQSTDSSAPVLTGQAGALITVLDAILVNGYGSKTAAGWTKPLSTTNKAAYLQNLTGANNASGMYLYVDDTGPGAGGAREARVCGFETMSAITPTGTGQFPTSSQSSIGVGTQVIRKSNTADATARPWVAIANGQNIYFFADTGDITVGLQTCSMPFIFGDLKSYKVGGDSYAVGLIARYSENQSGALYDSLSVIPPVQWNQTRVPQLQPTYLGHYIARQYTGVGGSKRVGKTIDLSKWAESTYGNQGSAHFNGGYSTEASTTFLGAGIAIGYSNDNPFPYPNPVDNSMFLSTIEVAYSGSVHGYYKGLWAPLHHRPLGHKDTFSDGGGKSYIALNIPVYDWTNQNNMGQIMVEYSDTWP